MTLQNCILSCIIYSSESLGCFLLLVDFHHYWVILRLDNLLLSGELLDSRVGMSIDPCESLLAKVSKGNLVFVGEVVLELLVVDGVLDEEAVVLVVVLGIESLLEGLIISLEFLSILDHFLDLVLGKSSFVVGDGDLVLSSGLGVEGADVKNTVGINIEGDNNLWDTLWSWWNTSELELSEEMVVLGHLSLSLVDHDHDRWLVIAGGGESLGLSSWDGSVSINDVGHEGSFSLDTHGKWGNIEEEELGGHLTTVTGENGTLNSGSVGNGLIWVDSLVELSSTEEISKKRLNLWDSSGSTYQNDLVNLVLSKTGILEDLGDWVHAILEIFTAKLLELGSRDVGVEIFTLVKSLALNWGLMCR